VTTHVAYCWILVFTQLKHIFDQIRPSRRVSWFRHCRWRRTLYDVPDITNYIVVLPIRRQLHPGGAGPAHRQRTSRESCTWAGTRGSWYPERAPELGGGDWARTALDAVATSATSHFVTAPVNRGPCARAPRTPRQPRQQAAMGSEPEAQDEVWPIIWCYDGWLPLKERCGLMRHGWRLFCQPEEPPAAAGQGVGCLLRQPRRGLAH
jgi:hypothetical protein